MSEIDKLEIKIVADATEAEKSVKKLGKSIEGIGKTGDSTKQIREIKSALESIKTPEIEINSTQLFKSRKKRKGNRYCVKRRESRTTHKKVKKRICTC